MADLVLSLDKFLAHPSFRGNAKTVYARALEHFHGMEKHTAAEWHAMIDKIATRPLMDKTQRATAPNPPRAARRR
jgi:hypothetical protein